MERAWGPFTSSVVLGNQQQLEKGDFLVGGTTSVNTEVAEGCVCVCVCVMVRSYWCGVSKGRTVEDMTQRAGNQNTGGLRPRKSDVRTRSFSPHWMHVRNAKSHLDPLNHSLHFNKVLRHFSDILKFKKHRGCKTLAFTWGQLLAAHW